MTYNPYISGDTLTDWFRLAFKDHRVSATDAYKAEQAALVRKISHMDGMARDCALKAECLRGELAALRARGRKVRPVPAWRRLLGMERAA